jgi:putative ABC transport system substrate-binding protein
MGYVEGRNLLIENRGADGHYDRLPDLAAELVRLNPDVIIAVAKEGIRAAQKATQTIPIVMRFSTDDPVTSGFVVSYARPGGNITGLTIRAPELAQKRLEALRAAAPKVSRIAVLAHPARELAEQLNEVQAAGRSLGVDTHIVFARDREYVSAFSAMAKNRAGAVFVLPDPVFFSDQKKLLALAARNRLPAIYEWREIVEAGGLMSYGPSLLELDGRVARYVDRLFKGASPADLPVEGPTKFELVINLKTAKALGLTIPQVLLLQADKVIE